MTICAWDGGHCYCQPQEGMFCERGKPTPYDTYIGVLEETVRELMSAASPAQTSTVAPDTGAAASGVMGPVATPEEPSDHVWGLLQIALHAAGKMRVSRERGEHTLYKHEFDRLIAIEDELADALYGTRRAARSAPAVPTGRESASQDVAHRDTREGLERSATELREQAEADAKRIFGGRSTTRDRE